MNSLKFKCEKMHDKNLIEDCYLFLRDLLRMLSKYVPVQKKIKTESIKDIFFQQPCSA